MMLNSYKRSKIKAFIAKDKSGDCATIVFADSANKAKSIARACECCQDTDYTDIRVKRLPRADSLYNGANEIDWYDPATRLFLVRDLDWACWEPSWECDSCSAKPYCKWP